jgi:hypothetical protein
MVELSALHQHPWCKSMFQSSTCIFVQFISLTLLSLLPWMKSTWWAVPCFISGNTEHLHFPGTIEMIATWEAKQYHDIIDAAKYLKVGKHHGVLNLFLCRNENLWSHCSLSQKDAVQL